MPGDPAASQPRSRNERRVGAATESMVVIEPLNPWTCTGCGGSGSLLLMAADGRRTPGEARARVRPDIDRILAAWQDP